MLYSHIYNEKIIWKQYTFDLTWNVFALVTSTPVGSNIQIYVFDKILFQ